jgi:hypothetical protein
VPSEAHQCRMPQGILEDTTDSGRCCVGRISNPPGQLRNLAPTQSCSAMADSERSQGRRTSGSRRFITCSEKQPGPVFVGW